MEDDRISDVWVGILSLIIFVSAVLIVLPLKIPGWLHFDEGKRPSDTEWRMGCITYLALSIAVMSGLMVVIALGFDDAEP